MSDPLLLGGLVATFLAVALLGIAVQVSVAGRRKPIELLQTHVKSVSTNVREQELSRSFLDRALLPVMGGLRNLGVRLTPAEMRRRLALKLVRAGSPSAMDAERLAAVKILATAAGFGLGFVGARFFDFEGIRMVGLTALFAAIGFFAPDAILDRVVAARQEKIRRELPDVMDLLSITVEAGLGFDAALLQVVENSPQGVFSREIARMLQEVQLGVSRIEALRHLADRTDVDDLNSFVMAMIQAEAFGVSISKVLRAQSKELRTRRRQRAEHRAMQIPVKIVFPVILFIFPALFVVVLGPAAIRIIRDVFGAF
ncbi:MAG TPA: type II secretion system F family protein [Actinomycetota bacterium]|nr:type II secretion system F family protein [Actinomycetota bacterium]